MVDNFALLVAHLMIIYVLWRCFILPEEDGTDTPETQTGRRAGKADPRARRKTTFKTKFRA